MQTRSFPSDPDGRSPAGAEIRTLMEGVTGSMIHSTVPPGQVNRATVHATVSEFWHVLSREGAFQYRCTGAVDPLRFLCISMPSWPGAQEATVIEGPWLPTAPE